MPSSLIFASLVVIWLLILVPAVARHRQEVARPTTAALSGRVLQRPRRPSMEVDVIDEQSRPVATHAHREDPHDRADAEHPDAEHAEHAEHSDAEHPDARYDGLTDDLDADRDHDVEDEYSGDGHAAEHDERRWERPASRYRRGRGGFDPEASALAARARYTFRQRTVLTLLVAAVVTGLVAAVAVPTLWGVHAVVDLLLIGYLLHLRRQVRVEEAIRRRRAARSSVARRRWDADVDADGDPADGDPADGDPADGDPADGDPADGDPADGDPADGDPAYGDPAYGDPDDGDPDHGDPDGGDATPRVRDGGRAVAGEQLWDEEPGPSGSTRRDRRAHPEHGTADADSAEPIDEEPAGVPGTGHARGNGSELDARVSGIPSPRDDDRSEPALPRLRPTPPPPIPPGTAVLDTDADDPSLHDLDGPTRPDYRRAAGQ